MDIFNIIFLESWRKFVNVFSRKVILEHNALNAEKITDFLLA